MDAAQSRECPLCRRIAAGDLVRESADGLVVALLDAFPLAEGHTLVVPRRHKPDLFGLIADESAALWSLALELARELKAEYGADSSAIRPNRSGLWRRGTTRVWPSASGKASRRATTSPSADSRTRSPAAMRRQRGHSRD